MEIESGAELVEERAKGTRSVQVVRGDGRLRPEASR